MSIVGNISTISITVMKIHYLTVLSSAGDTGLCLLAEHCHRLKSLNLCETLVTDEGLLVCVSKN